MPLQIESHHFDPRPILPLQLAAKRYTGAKASTSSQDKYTLVLFHGAGFIKESWEPVLDHLFQTLATKESSFEVEEAWAFDCQNHGEAAGLNEDALQQEPYTISFETSDWAEGAYHMLNARLFLDKENLKPVESRRKLIGLGHSIGAVTMLHMAQTWPTLFTSLILLDPILFPNSFSKAWSRTVSHLVASAYQRRDVWPSQKAAIKDLSSNGAFKTWDRRQIEMFVNYGMRPHPGKNHSVPYNGLTLCCTREQEAALYRGGVALRASVLQKLSWLTNRTPIYVAFGEINDSVPRPVQDALTEPSTGHNFVSVTRIPNAGHLVVQQNPAGCADVIFNSLQHLTSELAQKVPRKRIPLTASRTRRGSNISVPQNTIQLASKL
ncbi:hypothetical protein FRC03_004735 [Tulasnella sp. 419]|nr:hypothetical protein FRC02_012142 [Tulasnella sp. 418]KAG8962001.1 hypothetical protein FRC03_004735 [Tulasnella sp. 419]